MDDVRKSIKIFIDNIRSQIRDIDCNLEYGETKETEKIEEKVIEEKENDFIIKHNQELINLNIALSKAIIKPYKDESFLAQIFVDTQEKKDTIDSIRKELTQFIMQRTHYPFMKLEVIASTSNKHGTSATTPVERFKLLMKSSPAIDLLRENFKCDIKY